MTYFNLISSRPRSAETDLPSPDTLSIWLNNYPVLTFEYSALCHALIEFLSQLNTAKPDIERKAYIPLLKQLLDTTYKVNTLLHHIFAHTSFHFETRKTLTQHRATLLALASHLGLELAPVAPIEPDEATAPFLQTHTMQFRAKIGFFNPWRLATFPRLRRALLNLGNFLTSYPETSEAFTQKFRPIDLVYGWITNLLSWIFLLPRLILNIFLTFWHTLPCCQLTTPEKRLTWQQRLKLQWRERWAEIMDGIVWIPGGMLGCFLLIGPLSLIGAYLTVAMFCYDVLLSSARAYNDLSRLRKGIDQHISYRNKLHTDKERRLHTLVIKSLEKQYAYEQKRHALSVVNNLLVTGLTFVALSCIPFPVLAPLIAAGCLVLLTFVVMALNKLIEKQKPVNPLSVATQTNYHTMLTALSPHNSPAHLNDQPHSEPPHRRSPVHSAAFGPVGVDDSPSSTFMPGTP